MTTPSKADEYYRLSLENFTKALEVAITTSYSSAGLQCGNRRHWASILFTKLCTFSISILTLCPGSKLNQKGLHWDFGAIGSLSRNVFECGLSFFYLGIEKVTEEELKVRLMVMDLHDCIARIRMSRDLVRDESRAKIYEEAANNLSAKLKENVFFSNQPVSVQKSVLKGQRACIHTQDEILSRMGEDVSLTRAYYHFLSSHTHTLPVGFSRMADHNRGHGGENEIDKCYISQALEFCTDILERSTSDMQTAFSDIAEFPETPFNWNSLQQK